MKNLTADFQNKHTRPHTKTEDPAAPKGEGRVTRLTLGGRLVYVLPVAQPTVLKTARKTTIIILYIPTMHCSIKNYPRMNPDRIQLNHADVV